MCRKAACRLTFLCEFERSIRRVTHYFMSETSQRLSNGLFQLPQYLASMDVRLGLSTGQVLVLCLTSMTISEGSDGPIEYLEYRSKGTCVDGFGAK